MLYYKISRCFIHLRGCQTLVTHHYFGYFKVKCLIGLITLIDLQCETTAVTRFGGNINTICKLKFQYAIGSTRDHPICVQINILVFICLPVLIISNTNMCLALPVMVVMQPIRVVSLYHQSIASQNKSRSSALSEDQNQALVKWSPEVSPPCQCHCVLSLAAQIDRNQRMWHDCFPQCLVMCSVCGEMCAPCTMR